MSSGFAVDYLGESTPRLSKFARQSGKKESIIKPVVPAVTCTAQSTYLTGKTPAEHGIVGNGWYDRILNEHHFWKQSNRLVEGKKSGKLFAKIVQTSPVPIFSGGTTCTLALITPLPPVLYIARMG